MTIEIRTAADVTEEHIEEALSMRLGEYGGEVIPWDDVIDRLERGYRDEDWGSVTDSEAIEYLKREVRRRIREARR